MAQRRPTSSRVSERARDHRAWRATPVLPSACHPYPQAPASLSTPCHPSFAATTFSAFSSFLHLYYRRRRCRRIRLLYTLSYSFFDAFWPPRSVRYYCVRSFVRPYVRVSPAERARAECSPTFARPVSRTTRSRTRGIYDSRPAVRERSSFSPEKITPEAFAEREQASASFQSTLALPRPSPFSGSQPAGRKKRGYPVVRVTAASRKGSFASRNPGIHLVARRARPSREKHARHSTRLPEAEFKEPVL